MKQETREKRREAEILARLIFFLEDWFGYGFASAKKIIAISCLQFGDTGKGKMVHLFAWLWAEIVVRCLGGDNAGHTFFHKGKEIILHLLPCGIAFDYKKVINIIASGVAFYPKAAVAEIKMILSLGLTCDYLKVALNAKLLLPHHILLDRLGELGAGKAKIGTTGKGIGPCYTDFVARKGLILNDILNPEIFRANLERSMKPTQEMLKRINDSDNDSDKQTVRAIMFHEHLEGGLYYSNDGTFNVEAIIAKYLEYGEYLRQYICDTDSFVRESVGQKNILLEGAQGYLLSIDHGTYPYVTSSDCSPAGLAKGAGLRENQIDASFGIIKGTPTRVGAGPFITELGGKESAAWCNEGATREMEEVDYATATINDKNEMRQGVALRRKGGEYGATTKRPRRPGWNDLPLFRYALDSGADNIIMTKFDVLSGVRTIKICNVYKYNGPDYQYGEKAFRKNDFIHKTVIIPKIMEYCEPVYLEFPGWRKNIRKAKHFSDLPVNLVRILKFIFGECDVEAKLRIISVGPGPEETIFVGKNDLANYKIPD